MEEAIKLGLKGALKLEGEGSFWQALLCAIISVLVAIAGVACHGSDPGAAAAPLVALLGGKFVFGVVVGAVVGAAVGGAINAIKGAVNGDFSFNAFGREVLKGLITGAIGGGIAGGLSAAANGVLQTASILSRWRSMQG
jgi:hypothetical protein